MTDSVNDYFKEGTVFCSRRWIVAYMGLWLGVLIYLHDSTMSVAIVCMVQHPSKNQDTNSSHQGMNSRPNLKASSFINANTNNFGNNTFFVFNKSSNVAVSSNIGELTWSKTSQSHVLSGYYYGKILSQIPAGWLSARFGGRNVVGCSMAVTLIFTVLIPVFARTSVYLVVASRFLLGMFVNVNFPTYFGLAGNWALPTERNRFIGFFFFGLRLGSVLGYSASGFLCVHGFDNGWASIFYIHGMIEVLFLCCWFALIHSSPEQHPRITIVETQSSPPSSSRPDTKANSCHAKRIPWRQIFTYGPIYATYVAHIGDGFTMFLLMTCLPMYMNEVLSFDIQSNGVMSSLPFITLAVGIFISGTVADFIRKKNVVSVTRLRKITVCIGFFGIAIFINVPGYLSVSNRYIAVLSLCICTLFASIESASGYSSNVLDIAPRYASVIFGLSNTVANIPVAIVPTIVAAITSNNTAEEWRIVFYLSAGVSVFSALVYLIFGDSKQAKWYQHHLHHKNHQQQEHQEKHQHQEQPEKHQHQQNTELEAETKFHQALERF